MLVTRNLVVAEPPTCKRSKLEGRRERTGTRTASPRSTHPRALPALFIIERHMCLGIAVHANSTLQYRIVQYSTMQSIRNITYSTILTILCKYSTVHYTTSSSEYGCNCCSKLYSYTLQQLGRYSLIGNLRYSSPYFHMHPVYKEFRK